MDHILYGFHPLREALRHRPQEVVEVLVARRRSDRRAQEITELCQRHRIAFREVAEAELRRFVEGAAGSASPGSASPGSASPGSASPGSASRGGSHNGFAARVQRLETPTGTAIDPGLEILVEDVQDPRNLGALLRVCEGAGVSKVWVRDRGSAVLTPAVARVSAGASEWLDVERVTNSAQCLERHKKDGFWVYGAAEGGMAPWEVDLKERILLCFGGEQKGLRARTRKLCDGLVELPMRGRVESLNLATAAAAILYEAVRQRLG